MVHNLGWEVFLSWQQDKRICCVYFSCWPTVQLFWLCIRKTEWVILYWYMHRQSSCHDWSAFWFHNLCQRSHFWVCLHRIRREMLGTWKMSLEHKVTQDVIKIINCTKQHALIQTCWHSSARRSMQSTYLFSYTETWHCFLKAGG